MLYATETSEETSSMANTLPAPLGVVEEAFKAAESTLTSAFEAEEIRLLFAVDASSVFEALLVALDALEDAFDTVEPVVTFSGALFRKDITALEADETLLLLTLDDISSIWNTLSASGLLDFLETLELFSQALPWGTMALDLEDTVEASSLSDLVFARNILSFADRPSSASSGS